MSGRLSDALRRLVLLGVLLTHQSICTSRNHEKLPTLLMHGKIYQNACTNFEKEKFKKFLIDDVPNSDKAFHAIDVILCSDKNLKSKSYVKKIMRESVRIAAEATGDSAAFDAVAPNDRLVEGVLAGRQAWDVTIQASSYELVLQYFANAACVRSVSFQKEESEWVIFQVGRPAINAHRHNAVRKIL